MDDYKEIHSVILKSAIFISSKYNDDVNDIGNKLVDVGSDDLTSGGFWIWDVENNTEFYSDKFRKVLGFEGEYDFPSIPDSWQNQLSKEEVEKVFETYSKHEKTEGKHPYHQIVNYKDKTGKKNIKIICSGTLLRKNNNPWLLVGTHKIL
jgi:PAS domain-containing protein